MRRAHIPLQRLKWNNVNTVNYVDILLIQCYTGWRPQELGLIRIENVDLEKTNNDSEDKTKAEQTESYLIHSKIFNLVESKDTKKH